MTDPNESSNLTTGAWCYYDNDEAKGKLYNWYAVVGIHDAVSLSDPILRKEFAPEGWHVPSIDEWTTLENYLIANGYDYEGVSDNRIGKSMASITVWNSSTKAGAVGNDQSLNNSSGFNAFPEGLRFMGGSFSYEGSNAIFWSSTENFPDYAWYRYLTSNRSYLSSYNQINERSGCSVRFIRN